MKAIWVSTIISCTALTMACNELVNNTAIDERNYSSAAADIDSTINETPTTSSPNNTGNTIGNNGNTTGTDTTTPPSTTPPVNPTPNPAPTPAPDAIKEVILQLSDVKDIKELRAYNISHEPDVNRKELRSTTKYTWTDTSKTVGYKLPGRDETFNKSEYKPNRKKPTEALHFSPANAAEAKGRYTHKYDSDKVIETKIYNNGKLIHKKEYNWDKKQIKSTNYTGSKSVNVKTFLNLSVSPLDFTSPIGDIVVKNEVNDKTVEEYNCTNTNNSQIRCVGFTTSHGRKSTNSERVYERLRKIYKGGSQDYTVIVANILSDKTLFKSDDLPDRETNATYTYNAQGNILTSKDAGRGYDQRTSYDSTGLNAVKYETFSGGKLSRYTEVDY